MLASLDDPVLVAEFSKPWLRIEHAARRAAAQHKRNVASAAADRAASETPWTPNQPSPRLPGLVDDVKAGRISVARRMDGVAEVPVVGADSDKGLCLLLPGGPPYGGEQWLRTEKDFGRWIFLPVSTVLAAAGAGVSHA
jgi:hypothetical protein